MEVGDFRELLTADIAIERGLVSADDAAAALARYWQNREASVLSALTPDDRARVEGEVDSAIAAAEGNTRMALAQRGVGRDLTASLQPKASHELSEAGTTIRAPLRALDPKRYVGFLPLGQGGMGVVYLALDSELNRRVAFKMIRSGMTDPMGDESGPISDDMVARFLQEAIVTGGLEHPGIVPIYELGLAPSGVPYYTMRLVRGERTLDDAIRDATTPEDRLGLLEPFLKICDAVGYAHSRGVIHRDLKPANIALGQFGEVVVLDWGLAKMRTRPELAESRWQSRLDEIRATTDMKTLTSALGTPGYMAPEAALADVENIDEKSDVYSLGAILYRILTGEFPFKFSSLSEYLGKVTRGIDGVPGAPAGLGRIVTKALDANRDERIAQVGELSAAIRSWQSESAIDREVDGLEVEAEAALQTAESLEGDALLRQLDHAMAVAARIVDLRPDHEGARAMRERAHEARARAISAREHAARGRLLKRVGVVGLLTATAATVLVAFLINAKREEAEVARQQAEQERSRAEDLAGFMLNDLYGGLEALGRLDLLATVAGKSDDYYRSLPPGKATDDQQFARALTLGRVSEILIASGVLEQAMRACRDSQRIIEALVDRDPENEEWRYQLSAALNRTGDVEQEMDALDAALATYRRSLAIRRTLDRGDPLARSLERVATVLMRKGERAPARVLYEESLSLRRKLIKTGPDDPLLQDGLATSLEREGDFLLETEGLAAGLPRYEESLTLRRRLLEAQPSNPELEGDVASCLFRIGHIQNATGNAAGSAKTFAEVLGTYRRLARRDPSNRSWARNLSLCLERMGGLQNAAGDREGALVRYREALAINRERALRDETNTRAQHDVGSALINVGDMAKAEGDYSGAQTHYNEALSIARQLVEQDLANTDWQADLHTALSCVGRVYEATKRPEDAQKTFIEALAVVRRLHALDSENIGWRRSLSLTLAKLGDLARAEKKLVRAEQYYNESVEIRRELSRVDPDNNTWRTDFAHIVQRLAEVVRDRGDGARALALFGEALEALRGLPVSEVQQRECSVCLYNIGNQQQAVGDTEAARATLREAEQIHRPLPSYEKEHKFWMLVYARALEVAGAETPYDHLTLGYLLFDKQQYSESSSHFARALADVAIRRDLKRGNLYNGACAAARAGDGEEAVRRLAEDFRLRRALDKPGQLKLHMERARTADTDLESLRELPAFRKLFTD